MSSCCFPLLPRPFPSPSPSPRVFSNPRCQFSFFFFFFFFFFYFSVFCFFFFPLRVYERHGACLCPEMLGSSVMWWVYIFKNNPHSSDYEHISNPKILLLMMMIIYIYFFSVQQCTVMKTILFYCRIFICMDMLFCVLHVVLKHFRENEIPLLVNFFFFFLFFNFFFIPNCPFQLISSGPYLFSPCKSSC